MRALAVTPRTPGSARLLDVAEPTPAPDELLVRGLALGICGTDHEILAGEHGIAPPGQSHLVLGHESLGEVIQAPAASRFSEGDRVVGIVRRPDPVPCAACAAGEWDMCRNGRYRERGIKGLDGYGAERWTVEQEFAVAVHPSLGLRAVLLEPTSIVAKAWEQIERIAARAVVPIERVLVTGAGPIGLLAALLAVQRRLEVHVLDLVEQGAKPAAVEALGAIYHSGGIEATPLPDVVIECTGAPEVVFESIAHNRAGGIVCLTGVSSSGRSLQVDAGSVNRRIVLENDVVFGSVNANRRHYRLAHEALRTAPPEWLDRLITRRVALLDWEQAFEREEGDIKVVLDMTSSR